MRFLNKWRLRREQKKCEHEFVPLKIYNCGPWSPVGSNVYRRSVHGKFCCDYCKLVRLLMFTEVVNVSAGHGQSM